MRLVTVFLASTLAATGCRGSGTDGEGRPLPVRTDYSADFFKNDAELGFAPARASKIVVRKSYGDDTVYTANYSIDEHGFRASPGETGAETRPVLFFGDSHTFGEGLNDAQTYPAVFQAESRGRYHAVNLAFSGYGPHHMLRLLETQRERPALGGGRPAWAVYLASNDHPARAAGRAPWDFAGPRYNLGPGGEARYKGPFRGRLASGAAKAVRLLLPPPSRKEWAVSRGPADDELFAAVTASAARIIRARYGLELLVVLQGTDLPAERLRARGIASVPASDIVPSDFLRRHRIRHDGHPDAAYQRRFAEGLARRMKKAGPA